MADYKTFLATSILTEDKVVTYRLLSRTLKIHVNDAKEMLYDFHRQQNAKKPDTIHATYLISGVKRKEDPIVTNGAGKKDGEDDYMQSSPFMASSMPVAESTGESSVLSITLVKEESLEEVRSQYEHVSSIHIYSIGPHPLKDLQVLSDITREIQVLCASEDAVDSAPKYGTILNKNVKRRPARRPPHFTAAPVPAPAKAAVKPRPADIVENAKPATKQESKPSQPSTANDFFGKGKAKAKPAASSNTSSKESTPNPPTLKRDSSSIFKSFAKAKPKLKREGTDSSAVESPAMSAAEDSPMKDVVSDDEEDTYVPPPPSKEIVDSDRKSRKEREAALKKMMEDEDEEEIVVKAKSKRKEQEAVEVEDEDEDEEEEKEKSVEKEEIPITVSGGRRRGRRRVMKKKTVKDDEGYLVTKEEPVWESFSEDEPVEKPKQKIQAATTTAKTKKSAAKAGQGNIMSFFGKK
ncbi:DNA polymerase subunit Cdc27 [Rhexocercosporidium sp. MPI-PUGE-AT-0058]|nr:DNA polymerase subunit Cdc27 [Rhexocercosporidium sp. MPI-PUGE-AT-0058]